MDAQMNIVEVSFNHDTVNLRLRLTKDSRYDKTPWRFSMTLGWLPDSAPEQAWRAASTNEQVTRQESTRQQLLKGSDLRGL